MYDQKTDHLGFPSEFMSQEEKKDPKYGLMYAKNMWSRYVSRQVFNDQRATVWTNNRKYAEGLNSIEDIKSMFVSEGDTSYANLDYTAPAIVAQRVDILMGRLTRDYKVDCYPTDPVSGHTEYQKKYNELRKAMMLKPFSDYIEKEIAGVPLVPKNIEVPEDEDDLKIKMQEFKPTIAMAAELAMQGVFNNNSVTDIEEKLRRDLVCIKTVALLTKYDGERIKVEYVDPVKLILPYSQTDEYQNIPYYGVMVKRTIREIAQMAIDAGTPISEEELFYIAKNYAGLNNNPIWRFNNSFTTYDGYYSALTIRPYDDFNILTVDFQFLSADMSVFVEKTTEKGTVYFTKKNNGYEHPSVRIILDQIDSKNKKIKQIENQISVAKKEDYKKKKETEKMALASEIEELKKKAEQARESAMDDDNIKVHKKTLTYRYSGTWVVNSEKIINYKQDYTPREKEGKGYKPETFLDLCIVTPNMYDMQNKSHVERMITHAKQIALIRINIQRLFMSIIPPGAVIDPDAVANVVRGLGNRPATFEEVITMFRQTGIIAARRTKQGGREMNGKPIDFLPNGLPPGMEQLINAMNYEIMQLDNISGGGTPVNAMVASPDTPVGSLQLAKAASDYSLIPLNNAFLKLMRMAAKKTAVYIQDCIEYGNKDYITSLLGNTTVDILKTIDNIPLCNIGINVQYMPDDTEIAIAMTDFNMALQQMPELLPYVMRAKRMLKSNPELAEQYVANWMMKLRDKSQQEAMQMQQQNAQVQMQSNQVAEQAKQQTLQLQMQVEAQKIQLEHQAQMERDAKLHEYKMQELVVLHESDLKSKAYESVISTPRIRTSGTA
jgi:hypothetical protein